MAWTREHVVAVLICSSSLLLILASISSTAWIKGCMASQNFLDAERGNRSVFNQTVPTNLEQGTVMFMGKQMCIHQGLFKVSMGFPGIMHVGIQVPASSLPAYTIVAAIGLISAAAFGLAAVVLHIIVANEDNGTYEAKSRSTRNVRLAMIFLTSATFLSIGGMAVYTGGTAYVIHQPLHYMAQFGYSIMHAFSGDDANFPGRWRRDLDISGLEDGTENYLNTMVKGMDPVYGYSLILGWIGSLLNAVAVIVTVIVKHVLMKRRHVGVPVDL